MVQPESPRYALVRDVCFGGAGSLEAAETIDQLGRPSGSLLALVAAAHRGAQIDRGLLIGLLDLEDSEQVTAYASLGPTEALEALERAPQHRALIARRRTLWAWPPVALRLGAASGSYACLK